jgi:hypothetical protein
MPASAAEGVEIQRPQRVARTVKVAHAAEDIAPIAAPVSRSSSLAPADTTLARPSADEPEQVDPPREWKHSGFVIDAKVGMLGCLRSICAGSNGHAADPGVRLGGFVGGNIGGVLELGVQGAWGRLRPDVAPGKNALDLYGIDAAAVQEAMDEHTGGMAAENGLDLGLLEVEKAQLQSIQAGLGLRIHFVRRGRVDAYVGSGIGYESFRADYQTPTGDTRLTFHGLGVPAQAGLSVYLTKRLALGADFEYRWTHFGVGQLQHPEQEAVLPLSILDRYGHGANEIGKQLPHFWTAGVTARLRL